MEPVGSNWRWIAPYRGDSGISGFIPEGVIFRPWPKYEGIPRRASRDRSEGQDGAGARGCFFSLKSGQLVRIRTGSAGQRVARKFGVEAEWARLPNTAMDSCA